MAFLAVAESVGAARRITTTHLEHNGCCVDSIDQAILLISELATNAVSHAITEEFTLDIDVLGDIVHVRLGDDDAREPTVRRCGIDDEHGRGLHLLDLLANRWGVQHLQNGKEVWFEVPCIVISPLPGPAPAAA